MRVVSALMIQTTNAGVAHYRLESWAKAAHRTRAGNFYLPWWDKALTETHPWEVDIDDTRYRNRILDELNDHVKKADVVVAQMVHTRSALDILLSIKDAYKIPVVTEIDDNILSTPTYNPADGVYRPGSAFRSLAIEQFKMSDAMIVSTPYLAEVYGEFNANIHVVPNSLDFRIWDNLKHRRNQDDVKIGWAGGASHEDDLKLIEPVVHAILEKHKNVRFCFVHGIPPFLRGIDRVEEFHDFTRIDRYPQALASRSFDIGMAPLVDNAFNRAKSNLRWLEYAGLKVPCVASRVGHFAETIAQMEDGVLCDSEEEWISALSWLVGDAISRKKIGKAANQKARRQFNVEANVFDYAKILVRVLERHEEAKAEESQEAAA